LLNKISPHIKQAVGKFQTTPKKGTHTTTFAEMFRLMKRPLRIESPGVKEWGLVDMNSKKLF
jgi:ribosome biogenesis GTPase